MFKNKQKSPSVKTILLALLIVSFSSHSKAEPEEWNTWCGWDRENPSYSGSNPALLLQQCATACTVANSSGDYKCVITAMSSSVLPLSSASVTRVLDADNLLIRPNAPDVENFGGYRAVSTKICKKGSVYKYGTCLGDSEKGPPKNCGGTNPIDILTGSKYQVEIDYKDKASENSLDIKRAYQWASEDIPQKGVWNFYDESTIGFEVIEEYVDANVNSSCGIAPNKHLVFTLNQSDHQTVDFVGTQLACEPLPTELVIEPLRENQSGIQLVVGFDTTGNPTESYVITYPSGQEDTFETQGAESKIISRRFINGRSKHFFYDLGVDEGGDANENTLDRITDDKGRKVSFVHDNLNQVVETIDVNGSSYRYSYDNEGRLIHVSYPDQTIGVQGDNPFGEDNLFRTYHYENSRFPTALTGISNELGVRASTWQYDSRGRASLSMHANKADKVTVSYNGHESSTDPRVVVKNPLGKLTTYHFDFFGGRRKITQVEGQQSENCAAANKNYTYYPSGLLKTKTDWKNNTTSYQYNTRNLESSRTEALGTPQERTITTEWHPTFNLRTKITEPGRETNFIYDDEGRLLSQSSEDRSF